ncbi:MAG: ABC transporter permease [Actinomycetota bacterium]
MTTTAVAAPPSRRTRLTFVGVLKSEFIKLFTLRSTFWCIVLVVVLSVGVGLLLSTVQRPHIAGTPVAPLPSYADQQSTAVRDATAGASIGELVLSVLGVLVISGEYSTGMIRSTFAAEPKRLPTLFAKAIVLGITTFLVALVSVFGTAAIIFPLLPALHVHPDWGNSTLLLALFGGALYLALISLIAFSIGAIIRTTAGGIASALGLILVVPTVLNIVALTTGAAWAANLVAFLPTDAGAKLYAYASSSASITNGVVSLDSQQGGFVLLAWFVVLFIAAGVLLKRRDA